MTSLTQDFEQFHVSNLRTRSPHRRAVPIPRNVMFEDEGNFRNHFMVGGMQLDNQYTPTGCFAWRSSAPITLDEEDNKIEERYDQIFSYRINDTDSLDDGTLPDQERFEI